MGAQKVLIAVDGSEQAEKALRFYMDDLHMPGNTVILGHVVEDMLEPSFGFRAGLAIPPEQWRAMVKDREEKVKALKEKMSRILQESDITCKFVHEYGQPGNHLVNMADQEHVNLIVMGTRGMGSVRRTILGSVSDYLLHHAHAQVCICKH